ncbi:hypothetical protein [Aeromonas salmonicida]|uniref:hypothetical protein n=1 Tax=Aeromonas salmonicida TaxID=645 RepID=UPI0013A6DB4B|nr:hypothetical protein [Aeromonas salmonicida]
MINKINFPSLTLILMVIGSAIQLGSYSIERFFIPVITAYIGVIVFLFLNVRVSKLYVRYACINLACCFLLLLVVSFGTVNEYEWIFDCIKITLPFIYALILPALIFRVSELRINFLMKLLSFFVVLLLLVELIIRVGSISSISDIERNFYIFKVDSPFFVDTNALAIYALLYLIVIVYYNNIYIAAPKILFSTVTILLYIFIVLSFSRAAIIGGASIYLVCAFIRKGYITRFVIVCSLIFAALLCLPLILELVNSDGSGSTKLGVWYHLPDLITSHSSYNVIWGFGINNGSYAYSYESGKYSHVLIPMLLGQVGVIGLFIYFIYFYLMYRCIGRAYYILLVPVFIVGLSYIHPFLETIFFASAVICGLQMKKLYNRNLTHHYKDITNNE